jgi:hypothetical protein
MEQRPLRLGDIVDDYCPRERRITNHAIVAIVNEGIRQTRCTTCEAEHVYKAAKVPRRRSPGAGDDAMVDQPGQLIAPRPADSPPPAPIRAAGEEVEVTPTADIPAIEEHVQEQEPAADPVDESQPTEEVWHTHRRLIRATLPRTEGGEPPQRPIPEFTMHQRPGRHGRGRQWHGNANGNGNVNGNGFGPDRRQGQGRNQPHGHGSGRPRRHRGKRSR